MLGLLRTKVHHPVRTLASGILMSLKGCKNEVSILSPSMLFPAINRDFAKSRIQVNYCPLKASSLALCITPQSLAILLENAISVFSLEYVDRRSEVLSIRVHFESL
jgi:hypothetical protein